MGTYDVDGATRIERYCNNCIKSVYSREQGFIVSWHIEGERNERLHPICLVPAAWLEPQIFANPDRAASQSK